MTKFLKLMYEGLGNNKGQRFFRFLLLVFVVGIISMCIINVGYDKSKGGIYWKPADISVGLKK
jgi:hypothetical protein